MCPIREIICDLVFHHSTAHSGLRVAQGSGHRQTAARNLSLPTSTCLTACILIACSRCTGYRPILDAFRVFAKGDSAAYTEEAIAASKAAGKTSGHAKINGNSNGAHPKNGSNSCKDGHDGCNGSTNGSANSTDGKSNGQSVKTNGKVRHTPFVVLSTRLVLSEDNPTQAQPLLAVLSSDVCCHQRIRPSITLEDSCALIDACTA